MYYFSWMHVHRLFAYRYNLIHFLFEHKQSLSFSISIGLNTDWIQGLTVLVIYVLIFKICTQTLLQFWIYWMRLSRPAEFGDWLYIFLVGDRRCTKMDVIKEDFFLSSNTKKSWLTSPFLNLLRACHITK